MRSRLIAGIALLMILLLLLIRASSGAMSNPFGSLEDLGMWVGAILSLFVLSFLYGDNPVFRFTENLFVGVTAAYWMVMGFWSTLVPKLLGNIAPEIPVALFGMDLPLDVPVSRRLLYCIPLYLGVLLLFRLNRRYRRFSVWPLAFIFGTTAGLRLVVYLETNILGQVRSTINQVIMSGEPSLDPVAFLNACLVALGVVCCLLWFYFTQNKNRVLGAGREVGLWILMVTFGAGFGFTVMGRVALLVGRVEFLLQNWLGFI